MKLTNNNNINPVFEEVYNKDSYDSGDCDISVTQLIDSPQIRLLGHKHKDDLTRDLNSVIPAMLGTMIHDQLSMVDLPYPTLKEKRFFMETDGWVVSGCPDIISLRNERYIIGDYKFTGEYAVRNIKSDWEKQLNVYAYLTKHGKTSDGERFLDITKDSWGDVPFKTVTKLNITAIIRDWKQREANRNKEYPQSWVVDIPIRLWPEPEQREYIKERISIHQEAQQMFDELNMTPHCTESERWMSGHVYAVMKAGKKRAEKLFSDRYQAEQYCSKVKAGYVEDRVPESTRCQSYCSVSDYCEQWFRRKQ